MAQAILIISDGPNESLRRALEAKGFNVTAAAHTEDSYRQIVETPIDLVVIDLEEAINGIDLVKRIRSTPDLRQVKILTVAEWGTGQATLALSHGADALERKQFDSDHLVRTVKELLRAGRAMTARASRANGDSEES
jgi:DNA-binding response OmpR family regulator